jgi:hypothetical protein
MKKGLRFAGRFLGLGMLAILCSCVGVGMEISLNADGTGRMTVEYRVSRQLEAAGSLDGVARWPSVPVGKADFERSLERLEGLTLRSFSSREDGPDMVSRALIDFTRLEDILPLLDYGGEGARLSREGDKRTLSLRLGGFPSGGDGASPPDPQLLSLLEQLSQGYSFAISLSAPSAVELRIRGDGEEPPPDPQIERGGRKAGFSVPLSRFFLGKVLTAEFTF